MAKTHVASGRDQVWQGATCDQSTIVTPPCRVLPAATLKSGKTAIQFRFVFGWWPKTEGQWPKTHQQNLSSWHPGASHARSLRCGDVGMGFFSAVLWRTWSTSIAPAILSTVIRKAMSIPASTHGFCRNTTRWTRRKPHCRHCSQQLRRTRCESKPQE